MEPNAGVKIIFVCGDRADHGASPICSSPAWVVRAWGIAPPAALFVVPALGLGIDTGVVAFACIALGYLASWSPRD